MANVKITDLPAGTALGGTELFESVQAAASVKISATQIKNYTSENPTLAVLDSATNTTTVVATLQHTTSATPAAGIGVAMNFEVETSAANNEIGGQISAVTTDVTAASEDFDFLFKLMAGGAAAAEKGRLTSTGNLQMTGNTFRIATNRTVTNAGDAGTTGDICWDSSYIYVCVATNTWKRVAIATWP